MNLKRLLILVIAMCLAKTANAQPEWCTEDGTPFGHGVICVEPWQPFEEMSFQLNFASTSCSQLARHESQVIKDGNAFNIYMAVEVGGCPGVPQGPLTFPTNQNGVPAGSYIANLYRLPVPNWPPPPFNPDDYALHNSVNFTVLGVADTAEPVPSLSIMVLLLLIGLLFFLGMASLRLPRKT